MKVKVQPTTQIGIFSYSVKLVPDLKLNKGCWGETNFTILTLEIDAGLSELQRMDTLVHEMVHIISKNYQCGIDEENAERMANGFCEFLIGMDIELDWEDIEAMLSLEE